MAKQENDLLSETIHRIRKEIHRLRDRMEKIGEDNTKASLIDPVLQALGWNTSELQIS